MQKETQRRGALIAIAETARVNGLNDKDIETIWNYGCWVATWMQAWAMVKRGRLISALRTVRGV